MAYDRDYEVFVEGHGTRGSGSLRTGTIRKNPRRSECQDTMPPHTDSRYLTGDFTVSNAGREATPDLEEIQGKWR